MNTRALNHCLRYCWLALALAAWPAVSSAQVAVAEIEEMEELPTASAEELAELVGPIALYPDDLLAVVLPASTFPLQIVEAARFLEALESDPSLEPDEDWDDSVVALTNYPEVIKLLNEDLDWTWRLGEAVVAQQADVISAIELFRDRAYAAGNLKSDDYQVVANEGGAIRITPVEEDVIYVPYYEPERVVVYQPRPVYYYYPRAYPVYYYPYPEYHAFHHNYFWGVTTAFAIGWHSHHLNVFHHSYFGHPYYGRNYRNRWWYRRPDIHVYNNVYVRNHNRGYYDRYRHGDRWLPNVRRTVRSSDQRVTRTRYYPNRDTRASRERSSFTGSNSTPRVSRDTESRRDRGQDIRQNSRRPEIQFRDRSSEPSANRNDRSRSDTTRFRQETRDIESRRDRGQDIRQNSRQPEIQFRDRSSEPSANRNDRSRSDTTRFRQETRDREQVAPRNSSRAGTVRPSTSPRQTQARQTDRSQVQPRQTFVRESQVREVRQRESRAGPAPARQSQPKATQSRQSAPKPSNAQSNRSRSSERAARSSQSRSSQSRSSQSRSSSRRDH